MKDKSLIIIPTYNEAENIEDVINKILSLQKNNFILVVDDNSPDGTSNIVENLKKDNTDKAVKLYKEAFNKLETANKKDKNNPDILNYMGFTSRKSGNFNEAEKFYLKGLSLDPKHNGINEYLGELYVQTNRIEKAKERLAVLKNCNCKEFQELELIIKTRGSKIY